MNYQERKDLISEKRKLNNRLKHYTTDDELHCLAVEVMVKRLIAINELLK